MSQADELLDNLSVDYTDEPYITVNDDRTITVPDELKHIAVQGDHNIETVTIDCPRYWDEYDFSTMKVYINYMRPDGYKDSYRTKNLRVSEEDDTRILFDWTISGNVTAIKGNLSFLVYIESSKANPCWHSRLNQQMIIDEGLSATEQILRAPDSIEQVLAQTTANYIAEAKAEIEGKTAQSLASIPEDYTTVNNMAEEALREKSNAIKMEAEGETIRVRDSANNSLLGLKLFGKTTQASTTGANLWNPDEAITTMPGTVQYPIEVEPNTTYTLGISRETVSGLYASNNSDMSDPFVLVYGQRSTTFTTGDVTQIYLQVYSADSSFTENDVFYFNTGDTLIEEPYSGGFASPSPEWPQEFDTVNDVTIEIFGKNYANVPETYTYTQLGQRKVNIPAGKYVFSFESEIHGGENAPSVRFLNNDIWRWFSEDMKNTTLVLSKDETDLYFYSNGTGYNGSAGISATVNGFMVSKDGGAYEVYKDFQTLDVTRSFPGIPVTSGGNYTDSDGQQWVCDEIDFERGVYVKRIGVHTFTGIPEDALYLNTVDDGDETVVKHFFSGVLVGRASLNYPNVMCTALQYDLKAGAYNVTKTNICKLNVSNGNLLIDVDAKMCPTLDALKDMMSATPMPLHYVLATPIETPLTDAELASFKMVRSNYPSTTVLNDSGAHMAIKYAADTKTYVDNNSLSTGTLVDTATGKVYRLAVTNGQLTVIAV